MGLPTIDRNATIVIYSEHDKGRENAVHVRVLSFSQARALGELQSVSDDGAIRRMWEMLITHIDGLNYDRREGEFGPCVSADWALEHLPFYAVVDIVKAAGSAQVLGPQEKKASGEPYGSPST